MPKPLEKVLAFGCLMRRVCSIADPGVRSFWLHLSATPPPSVQATPCRRHVTHLRQFVAHPKQAGQLADRKRTFDRVSQVRNSWHLKWHAETSTPLCNSQVKQVLRVSGLTTPPC